MTNLKLDSMTKEDPQDEVYSSDSFASAITRSDVIWKDILGGNGDRYRILTGDRTTGTLHIGHYFGSLKNRVELQNLGVETFVLMADYQALTDRDADDTIAKSVRNVLLDYLAVGIDPTKSVIFAHSLVPALNQLILPFLGVVSLSELQRNPTVKDEIAQLGTKAVSGLMLTYPVHQAADILFCKGNIVPVGKDQLPHIEMTRTIARRINQKYFKQDYFPETDALISDIPLLVGLDGRKMSKSLGNTINISSTDDETAQVIKTAKTDSERYITFDPQARPEIANLLRILAVCTGRTPESWAEEIGNNGAGALKKQLTESVNECFRPIRARRKEWESQQDLALSYLQAGVERANEIANATLADLREAMGMAYYAS